MEYKCRIQRRFKWNCNKKQTRKDILKTYFTNTNSKQKFRNKQEIENAIKSINDEMDEAQKEFSKLFISNDYTK